MFVIKYMYITSGLIIAAIGEGYVFIYVGLYFRLLVCLFECKQRNGQTCERILVKLSG